MRATNTRLALAAAFLAGFGMLAAPGASAQAALDARQARLLSNNCVQCHARPGIGAPLMGRPQDWSERNRQGMDRLLLNTVQGLRSMPPLGYCSACTEADFRRLIQLMSGVGEPPA